MRFRSDDQRRAMFARMGDSDGPSGAKCDARSGILGDEYVIFTFLNKTRDPVAEGVASDVKYMKRLDDVSGMGPSLPKTIGRSLGPVIKTTREKNEAVLAEVMEEFPRVKENVVSGSDDIKIVPREDPMDAKLKTVLEGYDEAAGDKKTEFSVGASLKVLTVPATPDTVRLKTSYDDIQSVESDKSAVSDYLLQYAATLREPKSGDIVIEEDKSDILKQAADVLAEYGKSLPEKKKPVGVIEVDDEYAGGPVDLIVRSNSKRLGKMDKILNVQSRKAL